MVKATVFFRVDAGPEEGLGHLQRCIVLADYLRSQGCDVRFVVRYCYLTASERLRDYRVVYLDQDSQFIASEESENWDAQATLSKIGNAVGNSWIVVDHYKLSAVWERILKEAGYLIAVIDDYRNRQHHADLLTSDSSAPFCHSSNSGSADAPVLVGPPYALLSNDFAIDRVHPVTSLERILVTYGAADPTGETLIAIQAIERLVRQGALSKEVVVDVVIGPLNLEANSIALNARKHKHVLHFGPSGLAPLIRKADLVLTAGGNSMVEALVSIRPCVVTVTAANQSETVNELHARGLITIAGLGGTVNPTQLAQTVATTAQSIEIWGQRLATVKPFDHLGAERVGQVILGLVGCGQSMRFTGATL